jgi:hypothetical protein
VVRDFFFYTWHIIAELLNKFTDREAYVIGTEKFTNVDATNRYCLCKAIELLKNSSQGSWSLVQAYNKHPDYDCLCNQHSTQQGRLGSSSITMNGFVPSLGKSADKCGSIVFKDSKSVLFCTNDLLGSPPEPVLLGSDEKAVRGNHGVAKLPRWTGGENLN